MQRILVLMRRIATFLVSVFKAPLVEVYAAPQKGRVPLTEEMFMITPSFFGRKIFSLPDIPHRAAQIGIHHIQHPVIVGFIDQFLFSDAPLLIRISTSPNSFRSLKHPLGILFQQMSAATPTAFPIFPDNVFNHSLQFILMSGIITTAAPTSANNSAIVGCRILAPVMTATLSSSLISLLVTPL